MEQTIKELVRSRQEWDKLSEKSELQLGIIIYNSTECWVGPEDIQSAKWTIQCSLHYYAWGLRLDTTTKAEATENNNREQPQETRK